MDSMSHFYTKALCNATSQWLFSIYVYSKYRLGTLCAPHKYLSPCTVWGKMQLLRDRQWDKTGELCNCRYLCAVLQTLIPPLIACLSCIAVIPHLQGLCIVPVAVNSKLGFFQPPELKGPSIQAAPPARDSHQIGIL